MLIGKRSTGSGESRDAPESRPAISVRTFSEIETRTLERLVSNTSTDAPFPSAETARAINDAYRILWEQSGGGLTRAAHATLWTPSPAVVTTQTLTGAIASIGEIVHLWVGTTAGSTGVGSATETELQRVELSKIEALRTQSSSTVGLGTYAEPIMYAVVRSATTTAANVNKPTVEVWPPCPGTRYFPAHYIPQFTDIDSVTVTTPDLNDIQSNDLPVLAAILMAQRIARHDLVPGLSLELSESTQQSLARKMSAMADARQDK